MQDRDSNSEKNWTKKPFITGIENENYDLDKVVLRKVVKRPFLIVELARKMRLKDCEDSDETKSLVASSCCMDKLNSEKNVPIVDESLGAIPKRLKSKNTKRNKKNKTKKKTKKDEKNVDLLASIME
jgi:hypothetical protein